MHILYVEDNEVNRALLERVVRARPYSIIFQAEGETALATLAADASIDLVLLDIELADNCSGLEVIRQMRARGDRRPVVAITAYAMAGDGERILAAGCDRYLAKPVAIDSLLEVIDSYSKAPAAVEAPPAAATDVPAAAEAAVPVPQPVPAHPTDQPTDEAPPAGDSVPAPEPTPTVVEQ